MMVMMMMMMMMMIQKRLNQAWIAVVTAAVVVEVVVVAAIGPSRTMIMMKLYENKDFQLSSSSSWLGHLSETRSAFCC